MKANVETHVVGQLLTATNDIAARVFSAARYPKKVGWTSLILSADKSERNPEFDKAVERGKSSFNLRMVPCFVACTELLAFRKASPRSSMVELAFVRTDEPWRGVPSEIESNIKIGRVVLAERFAVTAAGPDYMSNQLHLLAPAVTPREEIRRHTAWLELTHEERQAKLEMEAQNLLVAVQMFNANDALVEATTVINPMSRANGS